jgi:hypothetical protein
MSNMELQSNHQFEFTPEQLKLLEGHAGQPLHVSVRHTNKVYLVIEEGVIPTLDEDYIRRGLLHAAEQAARGDENEWSVDEIKAAGRELIAQKKAQS